MSSLSVLCVYENDRAHCGLLNEKIDYKWSCKRRYDWRHWSHFIEYHRYTVALTDESELSLYVKYPNVFVAEKGSKSVRDGTLAGQIFWKVWTTGFSNMYNSTSISLSCRCRSDR